MKKNRLLKYLLLILFAGLTFIPTKALALTNDYRDIVSDVTNASTSNNKINIYLFYSATCPHCHDEIKYLESVKKEYKNYINIYKYEVINSMTNYQYLESVKSIVGSNSTSVPFTVIGDEYYIGFSDLIEEQIDNQINYYLDLKDKDTTYTLPILGSVDIKNVSIPLVGVVLGIIDGFNPCAMWVLLFLISMLLNIKDRKKMWFFGFSFLATSGLVYFLSMLGMSFILGFTSVAWIKVLIALVAIAAGVFNLKKFRESKDNGCDIIEDKKRKRYFQKIKKFTSEKNFLIALIGIITLAISVNLVELACSLGFPMIYSEILALNNIEGFSKILYLLLYTLFYLIDDIIVFVIAMVTLEMSGASTKYSKYSHLIGGILMIIMGLLLIFKPEWIMFNF